ncbi:ABC transporter permease [Amycolatopsis sp. GM8]|uniref:ABC transporter permease n=1 Tax=Amycolatopsis sp. GM8 TaxID=2896530 RepID=UPI001F337762|nr:ABC transporter permease [Amycolatopsis sp. GM8]
MAGVLTVPAPRDRRAGRLARLLGTRIAASVVVLWAAVTAVFFLLRLMPGNTVDVLLARSQVSPQVRAQVIAAYRLDGSVGTQYLAYLGRVLTGDLGESYVLREPVATAIGQQLPDSLALLAATMVITVVASVVLAILGASRRPWVRSSFTAVESLASSVPPFWLGLLLLTVFSFTLHWFPAIGSGGLPGLVLPSIALAASAVAVVTRVLREGLLHALEEPFVVTARARGTGELAVRFRHVLRHALLPVTTILGWMAGSLIGGAVIVEIVFSRAGIGRLTLSAVQNRDMPVVTGVVLLAAVIFVVVNILVDVLNWIVDPRTRG